MSWNGTVRCSHCGQRGHNKRGCSVLKEWVAERRITHGDNDYYVASADRKAASAKTRQCSFCRETGHNRRGCKTLKSAKIAAKTRLHTNRQFLLGWVTANATSFPGVGNIAFCSWAKKPYVITGIDWGVFDNLERDATDTDVQAYFADNDLHYYREIFIGKRIGDFRRTERFSAVQLARTSSDLKGFVPKPPADLLTDAALATIVDGHFAKHGRWFHGYR